MARAKKAKTKHFAYEVDIVANMILIETEVMDRAVDPRDRILFVEAWIEDVLASDALGNQKMYEVGNEALEVLRQIRRARSNKKKEDAMQKLRKIRKEFSDGIDLSAPPSDPPKAFAVRSFNHVPQEMKLKPLLHPMFNVLEIMKQALLLRQHLANKELRCSNCIIKHSIMIEALAQEALTLDTKLLYAKELRQVRDMSSGLRRTFSIREPSVYAKMYEINNGIIDYAREKLESLDNKTKKRLYEC
jgi:hypothetical protein